MFGWNTVEFEPVLRTNVQKSQWIQIKIEFSEKHLSEKYVFSYRINDITSTNEMSW